MYKQPTRQQNDNNYEDYADDDFKTPVNPINLKHKIHVLVFKARIFAK